MSADPVIVNEIVEKLKSQGLFDRFRKQCLADIDTRPSYRNLMLRVESHVNKFLESQRWSNNLDEFQLRERLRRNISNTDVLTAGVEWIVDQVISPKIESEFKPPIDKVVCETLGVSHSKWLETQSPEKHHTTDSFIVNDNAILLKPNINYSPSGSSKVKSEASLSNAPATINNSTPQSHFPVANIHGGHLQPPPLTARPPPIPPFSNFPPPPPPPHQAFGAPPGGFPSRLPPYMPPNFIPNPSNFMAPPPPPPPMVMPPLPPEEIPPPPPEEEFCAPPPPPPPPEEMDIGVMDEDVIEEEVTEENMVEEITEYSEDISLSTTERDATEIEESALELSKDSNVATLSGKRHLIWEGVHLDLDDISDISVSSVHTSDLSEVDQIAAAMSPNSPKRQRGKRRSSSMSDSHPKCKTRGKTNSANDIRQSKERRSSYKETDDRKSTSKLHSRSYRKSNKEYKTSAADDSRRNRQSYDDIRKSQRRSTSIQKRSSLSRSANRLNRKSFRSSSEESHRSNSDFSGFSSESSLNSQHSRRRAKHSTTKRMELERTKRRTKASSQSELSPVKKENAKLSAQPHHGHHSKHGIKRESTSRTTSASELAQEILQSISQALPGNSANANDEKEIRRQQIQQRLQEIAAQQKLLQLQQKEEQQLNHFKSDTAGPVTLESLEEPSTSVHSDKARRLSLEEIKPCKASNSETEEGELSDSDSNSDVQPRRPSSTHRLRSSSRDTPLMRKSSRQDDVNQPRRSTSTGESQKVRRISSNKSSPHSGKLSSHSRSSSRSSVSSRERKLSHR